MRGLARTLCVWGLVGCGAEAPPQVVSPPVAEQAGVPAPGSAPPPMLSAEDQAFVASLAPFLESVRTSSARCHALFDPLTPEGVRAHGLPFDEATLNEACGEAGSLYDSALPKYANHDRATDVLLTHVARVADDLDYTKRTFKDTFDEQVNARKHIHDALAAVDAALAQWQTSIPMAYEAGASQPDPGMWVRDVQNDGEGLPMLRTLYGQLAFNQGFKKSMVRHRMLDSFVRVARRPVDARQGMVDAVKDPAEKALRQTYLDACKRYLDVYQSVLDAFAEGRVPDEATHEARVAEADKALEEFKKAWSVEHARVGGTGG